MALEDLLDEPDAIARMRALPAFGNRPEWANRPEDAAIGNWVTSVVGRDREVCVRAALAAVCVVLRRIPAAPLEELAVDPAWVDAQIEAIYGWLGTQHDMTADLAAATIDVTRQTSAWRDFDVVDAWITEAADFAIQTISSPPALVAAGRSHDPSTCAALASISSVRALVCVDVQAEQAVLIVARAVRASMPKPRR